MDEQDGQVAKMILLSFKISSKWDRTVFIANGIRSTCCRNQNAESGSLIPATFNAVLIIIFKICREKSQPTRLRLKKIIRAMTSDNVMSTNGGKWKIWEAAMHISIRNTDKGYAYKLCTGSVRYLLQAHLVC